MQLSYIIWRNARSLLAVRLFGFQFKSSYNATWPDMPRIDYSEHPLPNTVHTHRTLFCGPFPSVCMAETCSTKEDRRYTYNGTLKRFLATIVAIKKNIITYPEHVTVALATHHSECVRRVILPSVACPSLQYFSPLSHKRHDFRGGGSFSTKCVFWFSLQFLSETILILKRTTLNYYHIYIYIYIYIYMPSCKVPIFLIGF